MHDISAISRRCEMRAWLMIPRPPIITETGYVVQSKSLYQFSLRWTDHHPASHYGLGVLLDAKGEVFDGHMFRHLRNAVEAWIKTDDPERICGALGVPAGEPGIRD